ncbi:MAG: hypothetical protein PHW53_05010 [Patescibacteria group bacterium]|nr:hypothetical protein [Patescibacteria group bacterium]
MSTHDFTTPVDVYRHLVNGGTIQNNFPGNEVTVRVVDNQFCCLNAQQAWVKYPVIIGNVLSWSIVDES